MKLKPLNDRIIIKNEIEKKTDSGIILPESSKEKPCIGIIVEVGNGTDKNPMLLKKGDKILYAKYAGVEFKYENELLTVLRQSDVLVVFEKE